jgi:hypothetical protein
MTAGCLDEDDHDHGYRRDWDRSEIRHRDFDDHRDYDRHDNDHNDRRDVNRDRDHD